MKLNARLVRFTVFEFRLTDISFMTSTINSIRNHFMPYFWFPVFAELLRKHHHVLRGINVYRVGQLNASI